MSTRHLIRKMFQTALCAAIVLALLGVVNVPGASASASASESSKADEVIATGLDYLGTKYQYGAPAGVTYAFDCSSFTQYIFKKIGIKLPRTSSAQASKGEKVAKSDLQKGDLVFFKSPKSSKISHVAVYIGSNKILHASGDAVKISKLTSSYWKKNYVTARRVL